MTTRAKAETSRALRNLARELGAQVEYRDVEGRRVRAGQRALRAVVAALGVDLETAAEAEQALVELRATRAARLVEPVHVVWDGEATPVRLGERAPGAVECTLHLEGGDAQELTGATLPGGLPFGYHELQVSAAGGQQATSRVISAPRHAFSGGGERTWGLFVPLYAARSEGDWGIGDLGTARELLRLVDDAGGRLVGSTPLLASFLDEPFEPSPYAPVSRTFWNETYLDVERLPEIERSAAARDLLRNRDVLRQREQLRELAHVDHRAVHALKRQLLEACAAELDADSGMRREAFESWVHEHPLVEEYATFRAGIEGGGEQARSYHRYVQWAMETQLTDITTRTGAGLYLDLPLGVHPDGFDRARYEHLFAKGMSVGAPPDPLAEGGQDWGLPPLHPERVREHGHDYTIASVRHMMRHAAAVRIDHVMGLHRLFWIPAELTASDGIYVQYDADEHWAIVCLESHRNGCMVVGEDLGTVPMSVRAAMEEHRAHRTYVAQFELDPGHPDEAIHAPPAGALAGMNTHDTPTWAATWASLDDNARSAITRFLAAGGEPIDDDAVATHAAALRMLARSEAGAVMASLEDMWGETQPQNVPGTSSAEAPNWVRRAARTVEDVAADETLCAQLRELTQLRSGHSAEEQQAAHAVRHDVCLLTEDDVFLFNEGTHNRLHRVLGSHVHDVDGQAGTWFAVWAPNAERVSVISDGNGWTPGACPLTAHPSGSGIWHGWIPGVRGGEHYKYHIVSNSGYEVQKADPFARRAEVPPRTASIVWEGDADHRPRDGAWMAERAGRNGLDAPMSVYEVHSQSWMRADGERLLTWAELAERLVEHVTNTGFTHVQLMPIMEHPFSGSWGYQTTGYFAPTGRHGTPDDFRGFVETLHEAGIGVLLDWVPSHFPADEHGLAYFDGTHLFEHADPRQGFHPDWKSCIFNYQRNEVRSFLLSSALFWLEEFGVDGLRVDAVASMLYLDYSREDGEWIPNIHGGRENLEAIDFLQRLNADAYGSFPDIAMIAEESTAWGGVSRPVETGGLGFGMKWDMGWMHDTLEYFRREPVHRPHHQGELTFRQIYAYTENFMLPLSHDEVVHGKGSLLARMPGDAWQQFANLRLLLSYMWTLPGKKLLFMGCEFAQGREWNHDASLDWHQSSEEPHQGILRLVGDLNRVYRDVPALHQLDVEEAGFSWVDASDSAQSVMSYLRHPRADADDPRPVLVVLNATPVVRHNYRIGVPVQGHWEELLNSDAQAYWGGGHGNSGGAATTPVPIHGHHWSLNLTLPPLGCLILRPAGDT